MRTAQIRPHTHGQYIDDASRTHKKKMLDEDARPSGRTDGRRRLSGMLAAWRPPRLSLAASPSPRQRPPSRLQCARAARRLASRARPPARASSDHASDPPFVGAAVRGIIERQAALPSTRHPVRLRPQAGRQESRQAGQVDVREAQQGENPRADRAQAGGVRGRAHTCSPRRPKSLLMMPYE